MTRTHLWSSSRVLACLGIALALLAVGCGGRGNVSGTVKFKGKPIGFGRITFYGEKGGKNDVQSGDIRDGQYAVQNVLAGPVKVTIETFPARANIPQTQPPPMGGKKLTEMMGGHIKGLENADTSKATPGVKAGTGNDPPIPQKYFTPELTDLKYTVNKGENTIDIDLPG
jgi:hypothetical protein